MKRCQKCEKLVPRETVTCPCGHTFSGDEPELPPPHADQRREADCAIQKDERDPALKYVLITIACGIVSIAGVFGYFIFGSPSGGAGIGYGKMVAYTWPFFSAVVFGILWPVVMFSDFFFRLLRKKTRGSITVVTFAVLLFAAILFSWSARLIYPSVAEKRENRRLLKIAQSPHIDPVWASSFAEDYLVKSKGGDPYGVPSGEAFGALLRNPATPVAIIESVAQKLNSGSSFWSAIAKNPLIFEKVAKYAEEKQGLAPREFVEWGKPRPEYLKLFSDSQNEQVRIWVARNKSTPPEVLEKLSTDKVCRINVARNPSTAAHVLEKLYLEPRNPRSGRDIREDIAENPSTPTHILEAMVKDDPYASRSWKAKDNLKLRSQNPKQK